MKSLKAIYPAITTPFKNDKVSYQNLILNINRYNKFNLSGYVVGGSNGEAVFLSNDEKLKLFRKVREHALTDKQLIAGTGSESIKGTIELTNLAAIEGADFALIITPHFFKNEMTHQVFIDYYTKVADAVKIPIIIYNVTKFTGVNISIETIALLSEHPNIIGIKNSTTNLEEIRQTIKNVPKDFAVLAGTGSVLLPALIEGAKGGVLALANVAPAECISIFKLYNDGNLLEAENLQSTLIPVNQAITSTYGVAGLKAAMDMVGYYGGNPRLPLEALDENKNNILKQILTNASLIQQRD